MPTADLDEKAKTAGYSFTAVKRAKQDLKKDKAVKYFQTGSNANRVWNIQALAEPDEGGFAEQTGCSQVQRWLAHCDFQAIPLGLADLHGVGGLADLVRAGMFSGETRRKAAGTE